MLRLSLFFTIFLVCLWAQAKLCVDLFQENLVSTFEETSLYSDLETWDHSEVTGPRPDWAHNFSRHFPQFVQDYEAFERSWALFSDPRIAEVQMGPVIFSRATKSTRLSSLEEGGQKLNVQDFNSYRNISRFLNRRGPPGSLITGAIQESVSPFYDLVHYSDRVDGDIFSTQGIDVWGTPNQISFQSMTSPFKSLIPNQFPESISLLHWRELSGYSLLGANQVIRFHSGNRGLQTLILGHKLLFNLLEENLKKNRFADPKMRELAEKIWNQRFNLGELKVSHDDSLFANAGSPTHTLAVTSTEVGSPIFLNAQQIENGSMYELGDAIALLAHELGHNMGLEDTPERFLDKFGAKLKENFLKSSRTKEIQTAKGHKVLVQLVDFEKSKGQKFTYFLFRDESGWVDLTPSFFNLVEGAKTSYQVDQIQSEIGNIDVRNEWVKLNFRISSEESEKRMQFTIYGEEQRQASTGFHVIERHGPRIDLQVLKSGLSGLGRSFQVLENQIVHINGRDHWELKVRIPKASFDPYSAVFRCSRTDSPLADSPRELFLDFGTKNIIEDGDDLIVDAFMTAPEDMTSSEFLIENMTLYGHGDEQVIYHPKERTLSKRFGVEKVTPKMELNLFGTVQIHPKLVSVQEGATGGARIRLQDFENFSLAQIQIAINGGETIVDLNNPPSFLKVEKLVSNDELVLELNFDTDMMRARLGGSSILFQNFYISDNTFREAFFNFGPNVTLFY